MSKDFKSIADKRLSHMKTHESPESLLKHAVEKNTIIIKRYSTGFALASMFVLFIMLIQMIGLRPADTNEILAGSYTLSALSPFAPPLEDPDLFIESLGKDDAYTQEYAINMLIEYYNAIGVREGAIEAIRPLLNSNDPLIKGSAEFGYAVLSGNFDNSKIIRLYDSSVLFTLFGNFSKYGSYNKLWVIRNGVLYEYYTFHTPQLYISGLFPSPDHSKIAIKTCSTQSEWITVLDIKNGTASNELVSKVIDSEEQTVRVYENSSRLEGIEWQNNNLMSFNIIIGEMTYSASYSCDIGRLWYHM